MAPGGAAAATSACEGDGQVGVRVADGAAGLTQQRREESRLGTRRCLDTDGGLAYRDMGEARAGERQRHLRRHHAALGDNDRARGEVAAGLAHVLAGIGGLAEFGEGAAHGDGIRRQHGVGMGRQDFSWEDRWRDERQEGGSLRRRAHEIGAGHRDARPERHRRPGQGMGRADRLRRREADRLRQRQAHRRHGTAPAEEAVARIGERREGRAVIGPI